MSTFSFETRFGTELRSSDPLKFPGYADRLKLVDELPVVTGGIGRGGHYALVMFDFKAGRMGGSMGAVEGQRIVQTIDWATDNGRPFVACISSGGARMEEGMHALVQMPRITAAMSRHQKAKLASIGVFNGAVTGGVYIALGSRTTMRIAGPGTTIGFAGPAVVKAALGVEPDMECYTSEYAHQRRQIDAIVEPDQQEAWVSAALGLGRLPLRLGRPVRFPLAPARPPESATELVANARNPKGPSGIDYVAGLMSSFVEFGGTDPTLRTGIADFEGCRVVVIASDRHAGNGLTTVDGFKGANRAMKVAQQLGLPLITFVDLSADPSPEKANMARAIGKAMKRMGNLSVPKVSFVVGEGGSGGALALTNGNLHLLENSSFFAVIAPELAEAIKSKSLTGVDMAELMRLQHHQAIEQGWLSSVVANDYRAIADAIRTGIESPDRAQDRYARATDLALDHSANGAGPSLSLI